MLSSLRSLVLILMSSHEHGLEWQLNGKRHSYKPKQQQLIFLIATIDVVNQKPITYSMYCILGILVGQVVKASVCTLLALRQIVSSIHGWRCFSFCRICILTMTYACEKLEKCLLKL